MAEKFVMALDQGTTSSRAIIFNKKGEIVAKSQNEFTQYYPQNGWVEHDPNEILFSMVSATMGCIRNSDIDLLICFGRYPKSQCDTPESVVSVYVFS